MMKIVAGLGNPGFRYRNTRHNIGFRVLDELGRKHDCKIKKKGFHGTYGIGRIAGQEVLLFKPLTYMNLSGEALKAVCSYHAPDKEDILVVSDDFNLSLGLLRLREKGSAGGHNGLASIIETMGPDFNRLRVGIGAEEMPDERSGYVLAPFRRSERSLVDKIIVKSAESIEAWIEEGMKAAMDKYNNTNVEP